MMKTHPNSSDPLVFEISPSCKNSTYSSPTSSINIEGTDAPTTAPSVSTSKRRKSVQFAYPLVVETFERPKATREEKLVLYWSERDISEFRDNYVRVDMLCKLSGLDPNITNNNIGSGSGSSKVPETTTPSMAAQHYPQRNRAVDPVKHDDDITSHHVFLLRDIFLFTDSLFHFFSKEQQV